MIEWIPIKDWKFIKGEEFLVLLRHEEATVIAQAAVLHREKYLIGVTGHGDFDALGKSSSIHYNIHITHAAKINLPVEKTLWEKFMECYTKNHTPDHNTDRFILSLIEMTREHYEEKK